MGDVRHRLVGAVIGFGFMTVTVAVVVAAPVFAADGGLWGNATRDGARMNLIEQREMRQIKAEAAAAKAAKAPKQYQYASVANCGNNTPDTPFPDDFCNEAVVFCAGNTPEQGQGPSARLFRREVDAAGNALSGWERYGTTCFPDEAPGNDRPTLTMAQVLAAFHDTDFAKPSVQIQPKGNVTLVTLPTYFELTWPSAGFAPGEVDAVDPSRMLGFRVEVRPQLKSVVYIYGDGSTSGATRSLGGPYPSGDIRHAYDKAGTFPVRADVTYTGQFRVAGGQWIDIPGQVTIQGQPEGLQVRTAKARLYAG